MQLSHYTSESGLIGISHSQSLHASDYLSLNDSSELLYALRALLEAAVKQVLSIIPPELRASGVDDQAILSQMPVITSDIKTRMESEGDYGRIYITSFAQGRNGDEERRGILTLWDRYTSNQGYCLQFSKRHIYDLIKIERMRHTYALLEVLEVKYGIDEKDSEFVRLTNQFSQEIFIQMYQSTKDERWKSEADKIGTDANFARNLLAFCGKHKDPSFSDEREIRILAFPVDFNQSRTFLLPIALKKTVRRKPSGVRHIILAEHLSPGVIPDKVIIAPHALRSIDDVQAFYPLPTTVEKSDIPIRRKA